MCISQHKRICQFCKKKFIIIVKCVHILLECRIKLRAVESVCAKVLCPRLCAYADTCAHTHEHAYVVKVITKTYPLDANVLCHNYKQLATVFI